MSYKITPETKEDCHQISCDHCVYGKEMDKIGVCQANARLIT